MFTCRNAFLIAAIQHQTKDIVENKCTIYIYPINAEMVHLYLYLIFSFRKKILQGANTDLFKPLDHKAQNSESQNKLFPLQMKPLKVS